jgi:hypothetical protein
MTDNKKTAFEFRAGTDSRRREIANAVCFYHPAAISEFLIENDTQNTPEDFALSDGFIAAQNADQALTVLEAWLLN